MRLESPLATWLDRATFTIAPRWTLRRLRARASLDLFTRNYEGASVGRRTQGWRTSTGDANSANFSGLSRLRENAQDLVRNNPYAEAAVSTVADHTVGWGIVPKPVKGTPKVQGDRFMQRWREWANTTACDADGRHDLAGLQKLVMRNVPTAGEILVRRRWRRPEDGLPLNLQLQVLEADYLDTMKDGLLTPGGGSIIQGIEYDAIGRRRAYWLFREHPGSNMTGIRSAGGQSVSVPAAEILHVFKAGRPGQARGASWFAPVMLRLKELDEFEDATLMKQKIAACLAVFVTDVDGTTPALGATTTTQPTWDYLEPGMVKNLLPGQAATTVDPPSVTEHASYMAVVLQAIAVGFGLTFEDLTGNYQNMPFSAARMSRLRHWARVEDWRWRLLIPQFCDPVWAWAVEAAQVQNIIGAPIKAEWTAPAMPMIDPSAEGLAYQRNIRTGIQTLSDAIRERGYDPEALLAEYAEDNKTLDRLKIVLDSDARYTTQQGGPRDAGGTEAVGPDKTSAIVSPATVNGFNNATNGYHQETEGLRKAFDNLAHEVHLAQRDRTINVTSAPVNFSMEPGAIQTHVAATPAPEVTVNAGTTIADGALRVEVQPPPPAVVNVEMPEIRVEPAVVNIERGAVQVEVDAPTTIQEGAVQVDVTPPPQPQITVVRTPRSEKRSKPDGDDEG